MAFKMKGFPYSGKSPMKGDKKTIDGKEIHVGGHEGHHDKTKPWGKESGLPMKSAFKQSAFKQETSSGTVTTGGVTTTYPNIRYLGQEKHSRVLNSLPGSVFVGGKNTGKASDVDEMKYSTYIGKKTSSEKKETTTETTNPGAAKPGPEETTEKTVK